MKHPAGRLDVVIVNFNTAPELEACLRSLAAATPAGLDRVIVADNGSTDGSRERALSAYPAVTWLALGDNLGFGAANNRAVATSRAELILFLNSDTTVPPGAIDTMVDRLDATGATALGPRLVDARGRPEVSFGSMLSPISEWRQRTRVRQAASDDPRDRQVIAEWVSQERAVDWVSGACLLVRREAAVAAGLFDEQYFLYEEDVDLCAALRSRGGRVVFSPAATVTHVRGRSVARTGARLSPHYDRSHLLFYRKHQPAWAPLLGLWLRLRGRSVR